MEFLHMSKELNDLSDQLLNGSSDRVIVTLVPNEEEFPHTCGQENRAVNELWKRRSPTK
jgi:hypothetical protein